MPVTVIVGAQWGDEGKGKIIDFLAQKNFTAGCRFNGGCNAGHTVVAGSERYALHHLPSTIILRKKSVLGNGMVIDPEVLIGEMDGLEKRGIALGPDILSISAKAHVILPYHKAIDKARGKGIGTTGRGIGPAYTDKASREGIRMEDLGNPRVLKEKLYAILPEKNRVLRAQGEREIPAEELLDMCGKYWKRLGRHICDTTLMANKMIRKGDSILAEGAQATMLDIDHGTYPFVTSSNTTAGAACTGLGIPPTAITEIIGVAKAYTTRVGGGPFPTEDEEFGKSIRDRGNEYGTTTGRPRRIGWPDWKMLKYSAMINGLTGMAVTKIDVLGGMEMKVATGYDKDGGPVYSKKTYRIENLSEGESKSIVSKGFQALPGGMKEFLLDLAVFTCVPISIVSLGPERELTVTKGAAEETGKAIGRAAVTYL